MFLEISHVQKEAFPQINYKTLHMSTRILSDYRSQQNQLSNPGLSYIEQECQESLIQGKIHSQQNSNKDLEYSYS